MTTIAILDRWYEGAARRRRLPVEAEPLGPELVGAGKLSRASAMAAARSVVEIVGRRRVELDFSPGASFADVVRGRVNLDGRILDAPVPDSLRLERLLGCSIHEAGHLLLTEPEQIPTDPLFRRIGNVLEDERIEGILAGDWPEFVPALQAARLGLLHPAGGDGTFLGAVFTLVRWPGRIQASLWSRYAERLEAVIEALTPYPATPDEIRVATLQVALLIPPEERELIPPSWSFAWAGEGEDEGAVEADEDSDWIRIDPRKGRKRRRGRRPRRDRRRGRAGPWPEVIWDVSPPAPAGYQAVRTRLGGKPGVLADRIRQMLPRQEVRRQSTGRLDLKQLHAYPYKANLFRSPDSPERVALSIALILDLSGSMAGRSAELAEEIGVLLCEAVRSLPEVRVAVYGHSADGDRRPSTRIVRFPEDSQGRVTGVGELSPGGNNRDAHAIHVIAEDLLGSSQRESERKLAILVADGAPSATDFSGEQAREKTREAILWLEQVWGPLLFIATDEVEDLRRMVPGPSFRFRAGRSVDALAQQLTLTLRRTVAGGS